MEETLEIPVCPVCVVFEPQAWRKSLCRNCFKTFQEHDGDGQNPGTDPGSDICSKIEPEPPSTSTSAATVAKTAEDSFSSTTATTTGKSSSKALCTTTISTSTPKSTTASSSKQPDVTGRGDAIKGSGKNVNSSAVGDGKSEKNVSLVSTLSGKLDPSKKTALPTTTTTTTNHVSKQVTLDSKVKSTSVEKKSSLTKSPISKEKDSKDSLSPPGDSAREKRVAGVGGEGMGAKSDVSRGQKGTDGKAKSVDVSGTVVSLKKGADTHAGTVAAPTKPAENNVSKKSEHDLNHSQDTITTSVVTAITSTTAASSSAARKPWEKSSGTTATSSPTTDKSQGNKLKSDAVSPPSSPLKSSPPKSSVSSHKLAGSSVPKSKQDVSKTSLKAAVQGSSGEEKKSEVNAVNKELDEKEHSIQQLKATEEKLRKELDESNKKFEEKVKSLEEKSRILEDRCKAAEERSQSLEKGVSRKSLDKDQTEHVRQQVAEKEKEVKDLQKKLLSMEKDFKKAKEEAETARREAIAEQRHDVERTLKELREQVTAMDEQCSRLEKDNSSLLTKLRAQEELVTQVAEDQIQRQPNGQSEQDRLEVRGLQGDLKASERIGEDHRQENVELRHELSDLRREMDEMYDNFRENELDEFRELQRELEVTSKNCRVLQFKLRKAERRNETLELDRQHYEDKLRSLHLQFESGDVRSHIQALEEELKTAKEVSVRLHDELDIVEDRRNKTLEENRHLTELLEQTDKKQFRMEMEIDKLRDQLAELRQQLREQRSPVRKEGTPDRKVISSIYTRSID